MNRGGIIPLCWFCPDSLMKTLGSYLLDKIFIRHFFLNQGVQTSEKILKACGYPNSSLVNTATCSKMNQDKNTEEEEQSKQKHAVTSWHAIKKKKKLKSYHILVITHGGFQIQKQNQRRTFASKRPDSKQADKVKTIGQWICIFMMLIHTFRIK